MFTYNSGMGKSIVYKFSGCLMDGFMCGNFVCVWGKYLWRRSWPENWHFSFLAGPTMCHSRQIDHCDSTGQAIGTHTQAQVDTEQMKYEQVVVLTGRCMMPVCILHMGTKSEGLRRAKSRMGLPA